MRGTRKSYDRSRPLYDCDRRYILRGKESSRADVYICGGWD